MQTTLHDAPPSATAATSTKLATILYKLRKELNFFRIHVTTFVLVPLILSGVFYASNGQDKISYIDSLFLCYSAMTVTGLVTVNMSTLTGWQQAMLFVLMLVGDLSFVSWVMVLIRKRYFRTHCEHLIPPKRPPLRRAQEMWSNMSVTKGLGMISSPIFGSGRRDPNVIRDGPAPDLRDRRMTWNGRGTFEDTEPSVLPPTIPHFPTEPIVTEPTPRPSLPDSIQSAPAATTRTRTSFENMLGLRLGGQPRSNAFATVSPEHHDTILGAQGGGLQSSPKSMGTFFPPDDSLPPISEGGGTPMPERRSSADQEHQAMSPISLYTELASPVSRDRDDSDGAGFGLGMSSGIPFQQTNTGQTVQFSPDLQKPSVTGPHRRRRPTRLTSNVLPSQQFPYPYPYASTAAHPYHPSPLRRPMRMQTLRPPPTTPTGNKGRHMGGFPNPLSYFTRVLSSTLFPRAYSRVSTRLERKLTMAYTSTVGEDAVGETPKWMRGFRSLKSLVITGNSNFRIESLTDEQLEDIGGVEYRALRLLSYVLAFYFILTQLVPFIVVAIYLAKSTAYDDIFNANVGAVQVRPANKIWSAAYFVSGAYTGSGLSLVDTTFLPFQKSYLMLVFTGFAMLAGNHALPIFLRLSIWIMSKFTEEESEFDKTLEFLLDHPRRCYIYMFPSHITWFLVVALVGLSALELFAFAVLNIGLPVTSTFSAGTAIMDGLFQSLAVRASGYAIVNLSILAPSVQFLYVVMMYIAIYPVAMSIRSTNVYEEKSLGVFEENPEEDQEPSMEGTGSRRDRIGKYLGWHIRRQLSYDLWWLVVAIWVICMLERDRLMDDVNAPWFNMFRIIFELVSAYGTIGLSLGIPTENFSFSGSLRTSSKIVVIIVMVRGRHRGLPVAVDRAVLLPQEYRKPSTANTEDPNADAKGNGAMNGMGDEKQAQEKV